MLNFDVEKLKPFHWRETLAQKITDIASGNITCAKNQAMLDKAVTDMGYRFEDLKSTSVATNDTTQFLKSSYGLSDTFSERLQAFDLVNVWGLPGVLFTSRLFHTRKFGKSMSFTGKSSDNLNQIMLRAEDVLELGVHEIGNRISDQYDQGNLYINMYTFYVVVDNILENGRLSPEKRAALINLHQTPLRNTAWKHTFHPLTLKTELHDVDIVYLTHDLAHTGDWQSRLYVPDFFTRDDGSIISTDVDRHRVDESKKAVDRIEKWVDKLVAEGHMTEDKSLLYMKLLHLHYTLSCTNDEWFAENTVEYLLKDLDTMFEKKDFSQKKYIYEIVNKLKYGHLVQDLMK